MPRKDAIDLRTRLRVVAHLRQQMHGLGLRQSELSRMLGVAEGTLSRAMKSDGPVGLDLVLAIHRKLHVDANRLLDIDPPREFFEEDPPGRK